MNNVTTPETAQRLKDAGFPQPEKNAGQFWYKNKSEICVIIQADEGRDTVAVKDIFSLDWVWLINLDDLIYAPTATDILRELGKSFVLYYDDTNGVNMWFCAKIAIVPQEVRLHLGHANPAEAAALAWLDKHENSSTK